MIIIKSEILELQFKKTMKMGAQASESFCKSVMTHE